MTTNKKSLIALLAVLGAVFYTDCFRSYQSLKR